MQTVREDAFTLGIRVGGLEGNTNTARVVSCYSLQFIMFREVVFLVYFLFLSSKSAVEGIEAR